LTSAGAALQLVVPLRTQRSVPRLCIPGLDRSEASLHQPDESSRQARRWLEPGQAAKQSSEPLPHDIDSPSASVRTSRLGIALPLLLDKNVTSDSTAPAQGQSIEARFHAIASSQTLVLESLPGILRILHQERPDALKPVPHGSRKGSLAVDFSRPATDAASGVHRTFSASIQGISSGLQGHDWTSIDDLLQDIQFCRLSQNLDLPECFLCRSAVFFYILQLSRSEGISAFKSHLLASKAASILAEQLCGLQWQQAADVHPALHHFLSFCIRRMSLLCCGVDTSAHYEIHSGFESYSPEQHAGCALYSMPDRISHTLDLLSSSLVGDSSATASAQDCSKHVSVLYLLSTLLSAQFPASFYDSLFRSCIPSLIRFARAISKSTRTTQHTEASEASGSIRNHEVLPALLEVFSLALQSPMLPQRFSRMLVLLVATAPWFQQAALRVTRIALVDSKEEFDKSDQRSILNFWASFSWLVARIPACRHTDTDTTPSRVLRSRSRDGSTAVGSGYQQQHSMASSRKSKPQVGGHSTSELSGHDVIASWEMCQCEDLGNGVWTCKVPELTRADASNVLQPLVLLPTGIIMQVLHSESGDSAPVVMAALSVLQNLFSCRGSPFIQSDVLSAHFVQYHYVMFLKLYLQPASSDTAAVLPPAPNMHGMHHALSDSYDAHSSRQLCMAHLRVLTSLGGQKRAHTRNCFDRQSVLQFLTTEFCSEFQSFHSGAAATGFRVPVFRSLDGKGKVPDIPGIPGILDIPNGSARYGSANRPSDLDAAASPFHIAPQQGNRFGAQRSGLAQVQQVQHPSDQTSEFVTANSWTSKHGEFAEQHSQHYAISSDAQASHRSQHESLASSNRSRAAPATSPPSAVMVPIIDPSKPELSQDKECTYTVVVDNVTRTVTLTGDVDDDLETIEALEDDLGVQLRVAGLFGDQHAVGESTSPRASSLSTGPQVSRDRDKVQQFIKLERIELPKFERDFAPRCFNSAPEVSAASLQRGVQCVPPGAFAADRHDSVDSRLEAFHGQEHTTLATLADDVGHDSELEVSSRRIYSDPDLHVAMLQFLFTLMLKEDGQLDPMVRSHQHVSVNVGHQTGSTDVCLALYHHLNHARNQHILPDLYRAMQHLGSSAVRLLKLLVHDLFPQELYSADTHHLARGTFANVQKLPFLSMNGDPCEEPVFVAQKVRCLDLLLRSASAPCQTSRVQWSKAC
jgi:hypothetical protein